jgi:mersacidin/lichenicidin family type 2 lantibiotic
VNTNQIIQAWKDIWCRKSLSAEQLALLPVFPVGEVELSEEKLATLIGATESQSPVVMTTINNTYITGFPDTPNAKSMTTSNCPVSK